MMKDVIISGFYDEISPMLDVQIAAIKGYGETYMCPRVINNRNISTYSALEFEEKIFPKLKKAGIKFSSIGSPYGKIDLYDENAFKNQLAQLYETVKICKLMGCKYIRIFSFYVKENYEKALPKVIEKLNKFLELAKKYDIILLHENEKLIFGDTPERILQIKANISSDNFGYIYDASNFIQCGVDPKVAYDLLRDITCYYHIKDCDAETKIEVPFMTGDGQYEYIFNDLKKRNFSGFMTLEPHTATYAKTKNKIFLTYIISLFTKKNYLKICKKINADFNIKPLQKVTEKDVFDWQYNKLKQILQN